MDEEIVIVDSIHDQIHTSEASAHVGCQESDDQSHRLSGHAVATALRAYNSHVWAARYNDRTQFSVEDEMSSTEAGGECLGVRSEIKGRCDV